MLTVLTEPNREFSQGSAVTIGNFDGVHRGHQALLKRLQQVAQAKQLTLGIILFEPQPQEFLQTEQAPARLTTWLEKVLALQALFNAEAVEGYLLTLHFEDQLAALSADDFIHQVLLQQLHTKYLLVGTDFKFGSHKQGDVRTLQQDAQHHNYQVELFPSFTWQGQRVSSTRIRTALAKTDLSLATDLLARPYTLTGMVIQGAKRGSSWGYPTANVNLERLQLPLQGVFAVWVHGLTERRLPGVSNIGVRPTVDGTQTCLEVHIFDFDQSIYGCQLTVEFVQYLRDEQRFASIAELKAQIAADVQTAKRLLKLNSSTPPATTAATQCIDK